MISQENARQFEGKLSQYGFEIRQSFRQNQKGDMMAEIATEKGEHLLVFLEETAQGMLYRFQPLSGEFAGKTFTLDTSELEKALPLIQKNLNEAAKLKIKKNWHFTMPLQNFLPMPVTFATQLLKEQIQKDEAKRLATAGVEAAAGQQIQKKVEDTVVRNVAALFTKTAKTRKIFTGVKVIQRPLPVAEKIRGEIPTKDVFTQSAATQKSAPSQLSAAEQQIPQNQNQQQEQEEPEIRFAQPAVQPAKKSKLLRWVVAGVVGGSALTIGGAGGFSLLFGGS